MGQRRLFAVGKQTLSSAVKHSVATAAWQLAFIPWRCSVCSQCKLLLNVIHALKLFMAIALWWRLRIKIPLEHCFWSTEWESIFPNHYWLMSTVISALFFPSVFCQRFLWSCCDSFQLPTFNRAVGLHLIHWCFTPQRSPWRGCPPCGGGTFSYAKINDSVLRWKNSVQQHHLYPLPSFP